MSLTLTEEDTLYCVCLDGRPIERALSRRKAEQYADYLAKGLCKHRAYDNRRTGELSIRPDTEAKQRQDRLYHSLKSHTTVSL